MRVVRPVLLVLLVVFVGIQVVPIARTNPPVDQAQTLERKVAVPAGISAILNRSCKDCHSNETVWPAYAYVAPASWFLAWHVNKAREDMNLSEWGGYDSDAARDILLEVCRQVKKGAMPVASYTLIHRSARLSPAEVVALCAWSDATRKALKAAE